MKQENKAYILQPLDLPICLKIKAGAWRQSDCASQRYSGVRSNWDKKNIKTLGIIQFPGALCSQHSLYDEAQRLPSWVLKGREAQLGLPHLDSLAAGRHFLIAHSIPRGRAVV